MPLGFPWRPAGSAITWVTPAGSLHGVDPLPVDLAITYTLSATSPALPVVYGAVSPLPAWLTVSATGLVSGVTGPDAPPVWSSPAAGSLGAWGEMAALSFSLVASGSGAIRWGLISGALPWGVALDAASGLLAGQIRNLVPGAEEPVSLLWSSPPAGSLGAYNERSVVPSILLDVPGATAWSVIAGALPWGVMLDATTGVIAGTLADLVPGAAEPLAGPVIAAPATVAAPLGVPIDVAYPASPAPVAWGLAPGGALPWGLTLDAATGRIAGTPVRTGTYAVTLLAFAGDGGIGMALQSWEVV